MRFALVLLLLIGVGGTSCQTPDPRSPHELAALLTDPEKGTEACCALLERDDPDHHKEYCTGKAGYGIRSAQRGHATDPKAITYVFFRHAIVDHIGSDTTRSDQGHVMIFDAEGSIVPYFAGANVLESTDAVVRWHKNAESAVIQQVGLFASETREAKYVSMLYVVPATVDQKPILRIVLGPETEFTKTTPWGKKVWLTRPVNRWRAVNYDENGYLEIEIGPNVPEAQFEPFATFHYSVSEKRYIGPEGSTTGSFYVLPPETSIKDEFKAIKEFCGSRPDGCSAK